MLKGALTLHVKSGLTFTDNSSIFMMATVMLTPAQVEAQRQLHFVAATFHIIQQDWTRTVAKVGLGLGCTSWSAAKLLTHHVGVVHVPVVITHCPPNGFVEHLHSTLAAVVAVHHTNGWLP